MVVLVVAAVALHNPQHHGKTAGRTDKPGPAPTSSASGPSTSGSSGARRGHSGAHRTGGDTTSPATSSSSSVPSLIGALPLVVLNDTETTGLAADAAQRFENGGWTATYANLPADVNDIVSTCAYFDPSVSDAKAVARALQQQYPTIKRVKPKFDGLPAGPIVVVLTPDYSPGA